MKGKVFSIEEFSVYDGPGIRTTVFLKGCPLECSWCHNPEGQSFDTQIVRSPNGCVNCGNCEKYGNQKNGKLFLTKENISMCPNSLIRYCGEDYEANELCEELLKNEAILKKDGGVTFSGGEPLSQWVFLEECLDILSGKLHTAIQTSGYADESIFKKVAEKCDYFLFDIKILNEKNHMEHTGVSNKKILKNFEFLSQAKKAFVTRIPLIPGVTDTEENIRDICCFLKAHSVCYAELLPYNKMAGGKYKMLMREYAPKFDDKKECALRKDIFEKYGIEIKVL